MRSLLRLGPSSVRLELFAILVRGNRASHSQFYSPLLLSLVFFVSFPIFDFHSLLAGSHTLRQRKGEAARDEFSSLLLPQRMRACSQAMIFIAYGNQTMISIFDIFVTVLSPVDYSL